MTESIDLGELGLDRGGHLLVKRALDRVARGQAIEVDAAPHVYTELAAWCRGHGHEFSVEGSRAVVRRGSATRLAGAVVTRADVVEEHALACWGLAARGATIEAGAPDFAFPLTNKSEVWADETSRLYAQAAAAQWDPASAIAWDTEFALPDEIEDAVVQVMTYLVENEAAALAIPAKFAARVHPHFREVTQLLAIQAADEARHVEVFTRRALLCRTGLGLSTAGGQASLKTLLDEPDFALSSFLLGVMGEGTFLSLLDFLYDHAPDPVTREVVKLARRDEARHVAFGLAHVARQAGLNASLRPRLASAVEHRHGELSQTTGLNEEVFDSLVLLAAGSFDPGSIRRGWDAVVALEVQMDEGRRGRLERLGFSRGEAETLSALHTKNFM